MASSSSSTSSLQYLSLTNQTLSLPKASSPFSSLSFPLSTPTLKLATLRPLLESRFVLNVAVSSEFDQAVDEEDSAAAPSPPEQVFTPDLKLFVGNLPFSADSAALAALFERAGDVQMVEVIYDKITGRSRGFGFVTMSSVEEVEAAAQQFNGYELDGRPLRVNSGPPPPKNEDSFRGGPRGGSNFDNNNRVYVGNLSWKVDNLALENLFREQGNVIEAKVVYDRETNRSRGFGFVTYGSADEVNSAIEALDGADLDGRSIRVSVAAARERRQF